MTRRIVIGIDPGAEGAVSAIDVDGRQVLGVALCRRWACAVEGEGDAAGMAADLGWSAVMPGMLGAVGIQAGDRVEVVIEAPQVRPGQSGGAAQGFRAGALASAVVSVLRAVTGRPLVGIRVVGAVTWTKDMGLQIVGADAGEKASVRYAARKRARVERVLELCPTARPMLVPSGCRVPHDGAADAILIGLYGAGLGRRT